MENQTKQPKTLLVCILVSSLITNIILLSITGASLVMIHSLNNEVQQIKGHLHGVRQLVSGLSAVRDRTKTRLHSLRHGDTSAPSVPRPLNNGPTNAE